MNKIFDHIKEIENNNIDFYDKLSDDEKKEVSHFMLMKWMSYTSDAKQILHMNTIVNPRVFSLYKYKGLLYKLLISSSFGNRQYKWIKRDVKKSSNILKMISDAHNCNLHDAEEILDLYSKKELLDLCSEMNYDKIDMEKLKKEINVLRM